MQKQEAFIELIKENEGVIYKITKVYAVEKEDQKDLYQEVVYQLWKSFDSFDGRSKVGTWVYRVTLNTSITYSKRTKGSGPRVDFDLELLQTPDVHDEAEEEKLQLLYASIKKLNVIEKGIIVLYLEGKNYQEISAIMGFTATNIGTRLNRIRQKLKARIKKTESWS